MNRKNHYLLKYLERRNASARIFGNHPAWTLDDCKREEVYGEIYCDLDGSLSPENLCADGELSRREVDLKRRNLIGAWRELNALNSLQIDYDSPELEKWHEIQTKKLRLSFLKPARPLT